MSIIFSGLLCYALTYFLFVNSSLHLSEIYQTKHLACIDTISTVTRIAIAYTSLYFMCPSTMIVPSLASANTKLPPSWDQFKAQKAQT